MYSLPRGAGDNIASQLFHLDHEGVSQLKAFIHLFDVGDAEGPFTFIPADATTRIVNDIRRLRKKRGSHPEVESRRYSDEEIAAVGGTKDIVTVKGPAGTGVAVDTSRCLHLGSRVEDGAFRLCLYLQYCTTHELTNVYDVARYEDDPVRHLAVKHSIEPGRARATDYTHKIMGGQTCLDGPRIRRNAVTRVAQPFTAADRILTLIVAAGTFVLRWLTLDFDNDYFMHMAWAADMLRGQWPVRDFVEPGFRCRQDSHTQVCDWAVISFRGKVLLRAHSLPSAPRSRMPSAAGWASPGGSPCWSSLSPWRRFRACTPTRKRSCIRRRSGRSCATSAVRIDVRSSSSPS